jgi:hypothetical protein
MTSLLFSAAMAVSGCVSAFCHCQLRTSLGRDVGENDPRPCWGSDTSQAQKSQGYKMKSWQSGRKRKQ